MIRLHKQRDRRVARIFELEDHVVSNIPDFHAFDQVYRDLSMPLPFTIDISQSDEVSHKVLRAVMVLAETVSADGPAWLKWMKWIWPATFCKLSQLLECYVHSDAGVPNTRLRHRPLREADLFFVLSPRVAPEGRQIMLRTTKA
ncbi:hypothetical protein Moror_6235 [Moniliophthora roreri MCA 2997]|uniref:Uncharacterized protein n=2 Tax=Moniliophthora roreri TaxID=221103 RepID=V2XYF0_MONRO|nr:hypothetical protein Moror_6235 [Moniliophthora roreri MCA 2997]